MKSNIVQFLLIVLVFISISFISKRIDYTVYYWFDASTGTYLHQNLIDDEISQSGYDDGQYNPKTLREKGYTVSQLDIINPPAVLFPKVPAKKLYTHP